MKNFISLILLFAGICSHYNAQTYGKETILIETPYGNMKLKLFTETPLHRANFLKLVRQKYYDSLMFHRVIKDFMIQGGDHLSRRATAEDSLGDGDLGYTLPSEFNKKIIHRKGRLAAARESDDINPKMASSASQFYLVMGKVRTMEDLKKYEERINKNRFKRCEKEFLASEEGILLKKTEETLNNQGKADSAAFISKQISDKVNKIYNKKRPYRFNKMQVKTYTTVGGTPHLDGSYTVFGEVIEGIEVIEKIASVKTGKRDRPLQDIRMKISLID